jgi:biopolymer transport protein ExbD
MKGSIDESLMGEINMTPLVDVMLVLLIVFMVTVPALMHSVPLELPKANSKPANIQSTPITVSVDQNSQVFWNQSPVSAEQLEVRMQQMAQAAEQPLLQIQADRRTPYEVVMRILAASHRAGLTKIGFLSDAVP